MVFSSVYFLYFFIYPRSQSPLMCSRQMEFSHPLGCLFTLVTVSEASSFHIITLVNFWNYYLCYWSLYFFLQKTPCLCLGFSILCVFSPSRSFMSYIKDSDPFWIGFYAGWAIEIWFHSSLCGNCGYKIFASWAQTLKCILICSKVERGFFPTQVCFLE